MKCLEVYTGEKTYMFPNGMLATPEAVAEQFPAALAFTHIVETDESGEVMFAIQNLAAMRSLYAIDSGRTEAEAIAAIQTIINTEPEEDTSVTTDERIAAALEYLAVASLPDTE